MEDDPELLLEQNAEEEDPVEEVFRNLIDLETEFLFFRDKKGRIPLHYACSEKAP